MSGKLAPGELTLTALKSLPLPSNYVCALKVVSEHILLQVTVLSHLLKALVGVDVVQSLQLVVVQHEGGRVQDQLGGGAAQLLQVGPGEIQGVGIRARALNSFLARHLADLQQDKDC